MKRQLKCDVISNFLKVGLLVRRNRAKDPFICIFDLKMIKLKKLDNFKKIHDNLDRILWLPQNLLQHAWSEQWVSYERAHFVSKVVDFGKGMFRKTVGIAKWEQYDLFLKNLIPINNSPIRALNINIFAQMTHEVNRFMSHLLSNYNFVIDSFDIYLSFYILFFLENLNLI